MIFLENNINLKQKNKKMWKKNKVNKFNRYKILFKLKKIKV